MSLPKLKKNLPIKWRIRRFGTSFNYEEQFYTIGRDVEEKFYHPNLPSNKQGMSFKDYIDNAEKMKAHAFTFCHDAFFGGGERNLHLTHPDMVKAVKAMHDHAKSRGIKFGASITNPLDLGRDFKDKYGVGGCFRFFSEGELNSDGSFSFVGALSEKWTNNKGPIYLKFQKARLFTYIEENDGSPYLVINPETIREVPESDYTVEISDEPYEFSKYTGNRHAIIKGKTASCGNRVFAVIYLETPEMDYFHPQAIEYMHDIVDEYNKVGVDFYVLYSDEMHIQLDWSLVHVGQYAIPARYMTENFERELAKFDPIFSDFDKALIYMVYDLHIDRKILGRECTQHVLGRTKADLYRTFELRHLYFEMLQDRVVAICSDMRDYIAATYSEDMEGLTPICHGHATWQESPTCDQYARNRDEGSFNKTTPAGNCAFDYTSEYYASSTIQEALSACFDYFKWNDYYTIGDSDYCESGWFDRNYFGGAMSASLAVLNKSASGLWEGWGFPDVLRERFVSVDRCFGTALSPLDNLMCHGRPRTIDVLYVYPKDLTAIEEIFGSWMVQYGYTNYATADKIIELGRVSRGKLSVGNESYSTVVVGFEPFYKPELLAVLEKFVKSGGTLVWNSTPPSAKNGKIPARWLSLFGLKSAKTLTEGVSAHRIYFTGTLKDIKPMPILSDHLPDRVYSVIPENDTEIVASTPRATIGVRRKLGAGQALYIGCRLRDDQSGEANSGRQTTTLFDVLKTLGAYGGINSRDNTETLSRTTPYFVSKFQNGTYALANHFYPIRECWSSNNYMRNQQRDAEEMKNCNLTPLEISLDRFAIEGHEISYEGSRVLEYRLDKRGRLIGFSGIGSTGITVDGKTYKFTKEPADTLVCPLEECRVPDGYKSGIVVRSTAVEVDICRKIPEDAEIYLYPDLIGEELKTDSGTYFKGRRVHNESIGMVAVILMK